MTTYGLTGGIGMGKSACAGLLQARGVAVVDTDEIARELVEPGQPALTEMQSAFGSHILDSSGALRRGVMAQLVFADPTARRRLEAILHPRIRQTWKARLESWRAESRPAAVVVIPLLFETQAEREFNRILCVACSAATQRERLRTRGWTDDQVRQRIAAQLPIEEKMLRSDWVIWTEGGMEVHAGQLDRLLSRPN